MPSQTDRASAALTAGICGPFFFFGCNSAHGTRRLHGRTKLAGEGRLWMMRWRPVDLDRRPVALHGGDLAAGEWATADRRRSGGPAGALDDIRTGPAYPSRGRRNPQPSR